MSDHQQRQQQGAPHRQQAHWPQPPAPQGPPPAPPRGPAPRQQPARRPVSRRSKIIRWTVLLAILAAVLGIAWYATRNAASSAEVGDCLKQTGPDSVEVVDCADPAAEYKVVGRIEDRPQVDARLSVCADFDNVDSAYWQAESGDTGFVLCLAAVQ